MKREMQIKEITIKLDSRSYEKLSRCAEVEHIDLESFTRHIILFYIKNSIDEKSLDRKKGGALL